MLATAVVFLFSCSNNSKNNLNVFKALDESLVRSNQAIKHSNEAVYASLADKLTDPLTNYKATIWHPKAMQIQKLSKDIIDYIEGLKEELKKEAGLTEKGSFKEDDVNAVSRLFSKKAKGEELYSKLKKYKADVLATDTLIKNEFNKSILFTASKQDQNDKTFTGVFFKDMPTIAVLSVLSMFQNDVRTAEKRTILFCHEQIPYRTSYCEFYSVLVGQNSSYVRKGDEIEITSGVGHLSVKAQPDIIVNGKKIPIDESGVAIAKFKAVGKPGKHSVPVQISYIDQDGNKQTISKTVEYTIAKE